MKRYKWLFMGMLVAFVTAFVYLFYFIESDKQSDLNAALARAETLGVPVYAHQLQQAAVPDEENGWIEIRKIQRILAENGESWPDVHTLLSVSSESEFVLQAATAIVLWDDIYVQAENLRAKDQFVPDYDFHTSSMEEINIMASIVEAVSMLRVRSRYKLFQDDQASAVEDIISASQLAAMILSNTTAFGVSRRHKLEYMIAEEIVFQAGFPSSLEHKEQLKLSLQSLYVITDSKYVFEQERVWFLEMIRMVSTDSESGNKLRKEVDDMDGHSLTGTLSGSALIPGKALVFEALGIEAACDYFEALSADINDYQANDAAYAQFVMILSSWESKGYPYGFIEILNALGISNASWIRQPYAQLARHAIGGEIYRKAFEIKVGNTTVDDGTRWKSETIDDAVLEYRGSENEFEITATFPDSDSVTLSFLRSPN